MQQQQYDKLSRQELLITVASKAVAVQISQRVMHDTFAGMRCIE